MNKTVLRLSKSEDNGLSWDGSSDVLYSMFASRLFSILWMPNSTGFGNSKRFCESFTRIMGILYMGKELLEVGFVALNCF